MANAVNITVTVDANSGMINIAALKKALQDLGLELPSLKQRGGDAFKGIEDAETRAHLAGMLFARTTGVEIPRALETIIARSQIIGPLMAGMFNVAVAASAISAFGVVYDKLVSITQAAGGYTEQVQKIEQATIQASQQAFFNPQNLEAASQHMQQIATQQTALDDRSLAGMDARYQKMVDESSLLSKIFGIAQIRAGIEVVLNKDVAEGIQLEDQRRQLLEKQAAALVQQNEQAAQLMSKNNEMGKQGYALAAQKYKDFQADPNFQARKVSDPQGAAAEQEAKYLDMQQTIMQTRRANAQETMNLQHQVSADALQGEQRIYAEEANALADLAQKRKQSLIDDTDYEAQRSLIHQRTAQQIKMYEQQLADQTLAFNDQAIDAQLQGDDLLYHQQQEMVDKARAEYERAPSTAAWNLYQAQIVAADEKTQQQIMANRLAGAQKTEQINEQLASMTQQSTDKMKAAEEEAALAAVPEWKQATVQLQMELTKRLASIQEEYDKEKAALEKMVTSGEITRDQANKLELQYDQQSAAQRLAIEQATLLKIQQANQKSAEQLGQQMETVFDDIGSGKIGTDILNSVKKLFFQILAEWILTVTQMGGVFAQFFGFLTGNNSSLLGTGGMFNGLFGGSSSIAGSAGGSGGGILGGLFGSSSGTGSANATVPGLSASSLPSALSMFTGPGGLIASQTPGLLTGATSAAGALTTPGLSAFGAGAAGSAVGAGAAAGAATLAAPSLGSRLGSLFNMNTLAALSPMLMTMLGAQFGGGIGQAGGMLGGLGVMIANMGIPGLALSGSATAALSGALLGVGSGLFGFGLGMQQGGLIGSLGGVGSGALMGLLAGGPIGALIGALAGLVGGIFGGLFGGSQRKKQANDYFTQQLDPAVKSIVSQYEGHTLDYATATDQLEQLRTQAQQQLGKLKGEGNSVFKDKVAPDIDAAEKQIGTDEAERTRRSGLIFGPPQFHDGGYVSAAMQSYTTKPGELLALLKHGEFVVNPVATKTNMGALQAMNSGGKLIGAPNVILQISAIDARSFDMWARNGGAQMISDAMNRHWNKEGRP